MVSRGHIGKAMGESLGFLRFAFLGVVFFFFFFFFKKIKEFVQRGVERENCEGKRGLLK